MPTNDTKVLLAGDMSTMYRTSGSTPMLINNIHIPPLKDVNFKNMNTGYIVGTNFTVRRTNNSGTSWQTIRPNSLNTINTAFDLNLVHCENYNDAYIFGADGCARSQQGTATKVAGFANDIRAIDASGATLVALSASNTLRRYTISSSGLTQTANWNNTGITLNAVAIQGVGNIMAVGDNGAFRYFDTNNNLIPVNTPPQFVLSGDLRAIDIKKSDVVVAGDNGKYFRLVSSGTDNNQQHQNIKWIENTDVYAIGSDPYRDPANDWISYITNASHINIRTVAIASNKHMVYGGQYNAPFYTVTNLTPATLIYPFVRTVFDPGTRYSSLFHYDKLGRLVVSQNARQRNSAQRKYSYTIYDDLGRVVEVGEKTENDEIANQTLGVFYFRDVFGSEVSGHYNPRVIDNDKLLAWVGGNGARNEVTRSYYDEFKTNFYNPTNITINQDNHPDCYFLNPSSLVEGQENMHRGQCLYFQLQ